jgi:hypothetical protein
MSLLISSTSPCPLPSRRPYKPSSPFLTKQTHSPSASANVSTTKSVNLYDYNQRNLLIPYGIAVLLAFGANVLGIIAIVRNGVSHNRSFSSVMSATRHSSLGKLPLPEDIARQKLRFVQVAGGGLGFVKEG